MTEVARSREKSPRCSRKPSYTPLRSHCLPGPHPHRAVPLHRHLSRIPAPSTPPALSPRSGQMQINHAATPLSPVPLHTGTTPPPPPIYISPLVCHSYSHCRLCVHLLRFVCYFIRGRIGDRGEGPYTKVNEKISTPHTSLTTQEYSRPTVAPRAVAHWPLERDPSCAGRTQVTSTPPPP
jgi:hypothetical protein